MEKILCIVNIRVHSRSLLFRPNQKIHFHSHVQLGPENNMPITKLFINFSMVDARKCATGLILIRHRS